MNSVTRSGTNQFHGDLFWFVRNAVFNAKDADALAKDQLKRNQFGGTIGGPIARNKLFLFAGYQGTKVRQAPSATLAIVPTQAMLNGDWTEFNRCYSPNWRDADFRDGSVSPTRYSNAAKLIADRLPAPTGDCGQVRYGSRNERNDWQGVTRIDYQHRANHTIFGRYMATKNLRPAEFAGANLLSMNIAGEDDLAQSAIIGSTWVINPGTVNAARVAWNRFGLLHQGNEFFNKKDVGIQNMWDDPVRPNYFSFGVAGLFNFGGATNNRKTQTMQQIQAGDDLSLIQREWQLHLVSLYQRRGRRSCPQSRANSAARSGPRRMRLRPASPFQPDCGRQYTALCQQRGARHQTVCVSGGRIARKYGPGHRARRGHVESGRGPVTHVWHFGSAAVRGSGRSVQRDQ